MTLTIRLESRADVRRSRGTMLRREPLLRRVTAPDSESCPQLSTAELAFRIFAAFRAHPHINNVLTHISRAKWLEVERSLNSILNSATTGDSLSPLEQNIIELMVAERGVTGKILKPYFHAILHRLLEPSRAERLIRHVEALFLDLDWKAHHPVPPAPASQQPSQESCHARGQKQ